MSEEKSKMGVCPHCEFTLYEGDIERKSLRAMRLGVIGYTGEKVYVCGKCGKVLSIA